ncbi:MAG TPA: DNA methylase [Rhodospirillaceae bacterium]|jgi:hypothetical protein|nr:DNA methylase [Alphaproteobacteria bacterium]HBH26824.1 DNA methylase [Rhodospirillaceae bacterium]
MERFTRPGDAVLDPFTGLGTTFFAAQATGRVPWGVEANAQRHAWVTARTPFAAHLVHGDSANVRTFGFPAMDFCLTSPPYMPQHHAWNPLRNGDPAHAGYDAYLRGMQQIFRAVRAVMRPGATVVVQADNLVGEGALSTLVWDLGLALSDVMALEGEIVVTWSDDGAAEPFTQCLVFRVA